MKQIKNKLMSYKKALVQPSVITVILVLGGMMILSCTGIQLYKIYTNDKQFSKIISYCKQEPIICQIE